MSFLDAFFVFSSEHEYKKILSRKIQLLSELNEYFFERKQIEYDFLQENSICDYLFHEIYPQFTEKYDPDIDQTSLFSELSQYASDKISAQLDESTSSYFNQLRDLFIFLSNFKKYSYTIQNPANNSPFMHHLYEIRSILYDRISSKEIFCDFLPFCLAQNFINLSSVWSKCSTIFNLSLTEESDLIKKEDDTKLFFSSLEPKSCCLHPDFNNFILMNKDYLIKNHSLSQNLSQQFGEVNELFNQFKSDFQNLEKLFENHKYILIEILPIEPALKILNDEGFYLFNHSQLRIKINRYLISSSTDPSSYDRIINQIKIRIESLSQKLNDRCQFESYVRDRYKTDIDEPQSHKEIYRKFQNVLNLFNEMIENVDIFDECIPNLQFFSLLFSDIFQFNNALSNFSGIEHHNRQIECLHSIIKEKTQNIELIQNETEKNLEAIELLDQNFTFFEQTKERVVDCELCKTNRSYVLTNCGHTFCDSCYQLFCNLSPEEQVCPFCETPFTFDSIVKICWSTKKTSDDDDDDD